ncbi:MAG: hypothetical protein AVDCRST_MAG31-2101, partial [uncultured Sphingomonas sp.]
ADARRPPRGAHSLHGRHLPAPVRRRPRPLRRHGRAHPAGQAALLERRPPRSLPRRARQLGGAGGNGCGL